MLSEDLKERAIERYPERVERRMKTLYGRLSEKDRRRYAAVETDKLGRGGVDYIAQLLGVDAKTATTGSESPLFQRLLRTQAVFPATIAAFRASLRRLQKQSASTSTHV